ncbi:MAG: glycosyltransferase [Candidatus Marinimicrobia bacterium]|nr:glycosyltransferase [Candidatus Neomarinimicrobiota bacterium]MDD5582018.1 glycosyltransferase [Candidatus Neomarinimicrobiota bacterium]
MKITVIIPVYNREQYIKRSIDSVLQQTRPADEVIVVDDGSTDATPSLLKNYGDKILVVHQKNRGVSAARNLGISRASGDWIALLDSDDEWLPDKLMIQEQWLRENPTFRICQTEEIWIRHGKRVNPMKKHQKYHGDIFIHSLKLCLVSPSAVLFEKSLIEEMGGFDESLPVCEDYDLWLRISLHYPIGLIQKAGILKYGGHEDQLSRTYWGLDRFRVQALEKLLTQNIEIPEKIEKEILKELIRKLTILSKGTLKRNKDETLWQEKLMEYNKRLQNISKNQKER